MQNKDKVILLYLSDPKLLSKTHLKKYVVWKLEVGLLSVWTIPLNSKSFQRLHQPERSNLAQTRMLHITFLSQLENLPLSFPTDRLQINQTLRLAETTPMKDQAPPIELYLSREQTFLVSRLRVSSGLIFTDLRKVTLICENSTIIWNVLVLSHKIEFAA